MQAQPVPTFYLLSADKSNSAATTAISQTGFLLGSIIKQADEEGASMRFQANGAVTQEPQHPAQLRVDLKNALQHSGLFLEAHLADVVAGKRSIEHATRIAKRSKSPPQCNAQHAAGTATGRARASAFVVAWRNLAKSDHGLGCDV